MVIATLIGKSKTRQPQGFSGALCLCPSSFSGLCQPFWTPVFRHSLLESLPRKFQSCLQGQPRPMALRQADPQFLIKPVFWGYHFIIYLGVHGNPGFYEFSINGHFFLYCSESRDILAAPNIASDFHFGKSWLSYYHL